MIWWFFWLIYLLRGIDLSLLFSEFGMDVKLNKVSFGNILLAVEFMMASPAFFTFSLMGSSTAAVP